MLDFNNPVIIWAANFCILFGILFILSRDPYFHPRTSWMLLVSTSIGLQAVASNAVYGFVLPLSFAGAVIVQIAFFFFWIWFDITAFF